MVMDKFQFKYFQDHNRYAHFTDKPCQFCGTHESCLEGVYFENYDENFELESICINCLINAKAKVNIPEYLIKKLTENIKQFNSEFRDLEVENKVKELVGELERTPPIPWIQANAWQICCGDFMTYLGELEQEDYNSRSEDGNGKEYLISIMKEDYKDRIDDIEWLWSEIGDFVAVYVFKCRHCNKMIAIWQCY